MGLQTKGSRLAGKADTSSGAELASDRRARRAAQGERDRPFKAAYEAGQRGDDPAEFQTDDALYAAYQDGARATRADRRGQQSEQLRAKAGVKAADGAGFVLGLIGYALLLNYLRGGTAQVRAWWAAKFLNRTSASTAATPARPASPATPTRGTPLRGGGA